MPTPFTIRVYIPDEGLDAFGEDAYRDEVVAQLQELYPTAQVEVTIGSGGRIAVEVIGGGEPHEGDAHGAAVLIATSGAAEALCVREPRAGKPDPGGLHPPHVRKPPRGEG